MPTAYQLKITLKEVKPAVWRRVVVPGNLTLARLHMVIQDVMGWGYAHLHQFRVGKRDLYGPDPHDDGFGPEVHNEKQFTLERLFVARNKFMYEYDFGDGWEHEIVVERV